jgi:hypothetical protein
MPLVRPKIGEGGEEVLAMVEGDAEGSAGGQLVAVHDGVLQTLGEIVVRR